LKLIKEIIYKLCGSCFIFCENRIICTTSINNCFLLNTDFLKLKPIEKEILVNISPFLNSGEMRIVRIFTANEVRNNTLDIFIAYWSKKERSYVMQNINYLTDTKKTFSLSLGGYPKNSDDLEKSWSIITESYKKSTGLFLIDVLYLISKPNILYKTRYKLAVKLADKFNKLKEVKGF